MKVLETKKDEFDDILKNLVAAKSNLSGVLEVLKDFDDFQGQMK